MITRIAYQSIAQLFAAGCVALLLGAHPSVVRADLDGHGPDAWRVTGVSSNDALNARMGPGTNYPIIETFAHDEHGLQQITCVPFYTAAHYTAMSEAQIRELPPRWCLMRNAQMTKAGWVAQRFITPDHGAGPAAIPQEEPYETSGDAMIDEAGRIVFDLYDAQARYERGEGRNPLRLPEAARYFTSDAVDFLASGQVQAHPLYGAQDFMGQVTRVAPDPDQPMFRGMITINVDFTNFGEPQRAIFRLRADTMQPGAPLRIFMVEHDGWSYP